MNRLLVPGETVESAVSDLERLIGTLGLASDVEVKTKPPYYEPYTMSKDEPIIVESRGTFHVMDIQPGATAELTVVVTPDRTADAMGNHGVAVLATPSLIRQKFLRRASNKRRSPRAE